jgi:hypothetical protein
MGMRKTRIDIIAKRGSEALVLGFKIYEGVHDAQFGNEKLHQYVIQALLQMPILWAYKETRSKIYSSLTRTNIHGIFDRLTSRNNFSTNIPDSYLKIY